MWNCQDILDYEVILSYNNAFIAAVNSIKDIDNGSERFQAIRNAKKLYLLADPEDVEVVKAALDKLTSVSNEVFTKMYQNANPNGAAGSDDAGANGGSTNNNNDGDPEVVID